MFEIIDGEKYIRVRSTDPGIGDCKKCAFGPFASRACNNAPSCCDDYDQSWTYMAYDEAIKEVAWWTCGSGCIELKVPIWDVANLHPGDVQDVVDDARSEAYVEDQLQALDPEDVRAELREYGAWEDAELNDHEVNLDRLIWLAMEYVRDEACVDLTGETVPWA